MAVAKKEQAASRLANPPGRRRYSRTQPYTLTTEPGRRLAFRVAEVRPQVNAGIILKQFVYRRWWMFGAGQLAVSDRLPGAIYEANATVRDPAQLRRADV